MNDLQQFHAQQLTRRTFLGRASRGLGTVALASLLKVTAALAFGGEKKWKGVINPHPIAPRARRVIYLCMAGGPSHLETFDYQPALAKLQGQKLVCFGPQLPFQKFGKCGAEICELFPQIGSIADEICIIRSMI